MSPNIEQMMAFENGELDEEQTVALFQQLVDSGMAWQLQGSYGRTAHNLIQKGLVRLPGRPLTDTLHQYRPTGYGRTVDRELEEEKEKLRKEAHDRLEQAFEEGLIRGFW